MDKYDSNGPQQSRLTDILTGSIDTIASHPVVAAVYIGLAAVFALTGDLILDSIGGSRQEFRYFAVYTLFLAARTPFDALVDAGVLSAILAGCRHERVTKRVILDGIHTFTARMFLIYVINLLIVVSSSLLLCLPVPILAAWYFRFITVYTVLENATVADAFRTGTSVVLRRGSWFVYVYFVSTLILVLVAMGGELGRDSDISLGIDVLGQVILTYVDLVVICISFLLFSRARRLEARK